MDEILDRTKELETKSVKSLLWLYAWPAVVSQIIASIYNIVDRIFIGQGVGPMAIAGLAITLPLMNIIHAFGAMIGVGSSSRMSIVLGRKDIRWAEKILGNSLIFTIILSGVVMICNYMFMDGILSKFGATAGTIQYAREYMLIVLPGMFLTTVTYNLTGLIRSSGYPTKSMLILAGGAILNTILDPIFIFGLHWGIAGAAWATTISMTVTAILSIQHFVNKKSFIRFKMHAWALKGYIFKNITLIGLSPFLMNVAASAVVALLNRQLLHYGGDLAVAAFGIANIFGSFFILVFFGICQGMQPIAGYNYGAGHIRRLKQTYILTTKVCILVGIIACVTACTIPKTLAGLFTSDSDLCQLAATSIRYLTMMFPIIAFTIVNSNFFQSIDKPYIAIITSLSRQVIFLLPFAYIIPELAKRMNYDGLTGLWWSFPVSDVIGAILAAILLYTQRRVFSPDYKPVHRAPRKEYSEDDK